jgi:hypothetical protein
MWPSGFAPQALPLDDTLDDEEGRINTVREFDLPAAALLRYLESTHLGLPLRYRAASIPSTFDPQI